MKRLLAVVVVLVLLALAGGGAAYWWVRSHEDDPLPEKRASSTDEFVPEEPPTTRPARFVRNEPWPLYGYDAARTRYGAPFRHRPPYRGAWSFRAGNVLEFPPVVAYDRVIFTQQRGRLFALRAGDGKVAWRKHFHRCAAASPAAGSSTVFVALMQPYPCRKQPRSQSGEVVAIRVRGGKILWRWKRTGAVESSPLLRGGVLYFGSWDHHVYALDVRRRRPRLLWRFRADDEVNTSPAYAGGRVYFATDGGRVYAVNARTGRLAWRAESYARFRGREYFYATPAVAYGRVFVGNTDGNVYAYGASSGRLLWASNAGSYVYSAPAIWRKTVYLGSYDGYFYAFDAATGARRWRTRIGASIHGAPTVLDGLVYFSTCGTCGQRGSRPAARGPRATYALDARTGRRVWRFFAGHYSPVVADRKHVYVAGSTRLYALEERSTKRSAKKNKPARTRKAKGQSK